MVFFIRNKLASRTSVVLLPLVVFVGLSLLVIHYFKVAQEVAVAHQQERLLQKTTDIRAKIEYEINTTLNLTMGVLVYVATKPDINQQEFAQLADQVLQRAPYIRNIGLAKDNVISHIFPLEHNRKALGLRYMDDAQQRDAVIQAMKTGKTVVAGPVNLVQGGRGFISRIPIFLKDRARTYWGMTSIVIDVDAFLQRVGLNKKRSDINIALRGKDSKGAQGAIFYGNESVFQDINRVQQPISLPTGSWIIAAVATDETPKAYSSSQWISVLGISSALLIASLLAGLLSSYSALNRAKIEVENASEHKTRFFT
ncbi:MAG: CHASE domain-containing protein, partial [Gammaproteobacteria bacterium]|nr:CHASE domain-containing protein [Gammaproteobacteria bacterium]